MSRPGSLADQGNGLALSDHVRAEQVKLDFPGDVGDAGLAGLAGGEVAGFLGLAGAGPLRAVPDEGAGGEDLQQERGEREIGLLTGNNHHLESSNQLPPAAWLRGSRVTCLDYGE